jgi:hypothetical protein
VPRSGIIEHMPGDADAAVGQFVDRLVQVVSALREEFEGARRPPAAEPLELIARAKPSAVRSGHLEAVGDFSLHGVGCLVECLDGALLDFDWDDSREVFDGWRLRGFAESLGVGGLSVADMEAAARRSPILAEGPPGWFSVGEPSETPPARA